MLRIFLIAILISFNAGLAWSQQIVPDDSCKGTYDSLYGGPVFLFVNEMPVYPGGDYGQVKFFNEHFRYPVREETYQTRVAVSYFVTPAGEIVHPHISGKSPKEYTLVDQEAIRVIKLMRRFKPGKCKGRKVAVMMTYRVSCMMLQE